jgi:hypothetical protein
VLDRGDDNTVPFLPRHPSAIKASADGAETPTRPAADSLTVAGRPTSTSAGLGDSTERHSLAKEVERLRKRARQQDETLIHVARAMRSLRRAGQALRAENRELRLALQQAQDSDRGAAA